MVKTQGPQGWIAVDWDGTVVEYHGWTKWNEFGKPIPAMVERIKGWLAEGKDVRIFTARVPLPQDDDKEQTCYKTGEKFTGVTMRYAIALECEKIFGVRLRSQSYKDLHTIEIWDDRAVGVEANTGRTLADAARAEAQALRGRAYLDAEASAYRGDRDERD